MGYSNLPPPELRWSKTDWERHLQATPGWWHDPRWGVAKGKQFRRWAVALWRSAQGRKRQRWGYCPGRHYNLSLKAKRSRGAV